MLTQAATLCLLAEKITITQRSVDRNGDYTMTAVKEDGSSIDLVDTDAYECQFNVLSDLCSRKDAHPIAFVLIGELYARGYGCKQDKTMALDYLNRAAKSNDTFVRIRSYLTLSYVSHRWQLDVDPKKKDYHQALEAIEQVEKLTSSSFDTSRTFFSLSAFGKYNGLSQSERHTCAEKAAQWGHAKAMLQCSENLMSGEGAPKDFRAAYTYALLAKSMGEEKDFWTGDVERLDRLISLLEKTLPISDAIKGQQDATEVRKSINNRRAKQLETLKELNRTQESFDKWCTREIGAGFLAAWSAKWKKRVAEGKSDFEIIK